MLAPQVLTLTQASNIVGSFTAYKLVACSAETSEAPSTVATLLSATSIVHCTLVNI